MSIAVITGLGNPGLKYRNTRHNAGFAAVDEIVRKMGGRWKLEPKFEAEIASVSHAGQKLMFVKPQTFMNASGRSIGSILRYRKLGPESLLVYYDDITLEVGRVKLSRTGSSGGHNGVSDLFDKVGEGFLRYRIGIGAKTDKTMDLAQYVLSVFSEDETTLLAEGLSQGTDHLTRILRDGPDLAMNFINQRTANKHERNN